MGWSRPLFLKPLLPKVEWTDLKPIPHFQHLRSRGVLVLVPANDGIAYTCMDITRRQTLKDDKQSSRVSLIPQVIRERLKECVLEDFISKKVISKGLTSKVRLVVEKRSGIKLTLKEIYRNALERRPFELRVELEHIFMTKVKSPWLVEMFQCYETPYKRCILMEYLPGPNLLSLVRSGRKLADHDLRIMAAEMLLCIFAVHQKGYMHRDIRLSNFVLNTRGHVKLCDFASCLKFLRQELCEQLFPEDLDLNVRPPDFILRAQHTVMKQFAHRPVVPHGTSWYAAPEVIWLTTRSATHSQSRKGYSYTCDYWSYGVCLYYLMFRKLPFITYDKVRLPSLILNYEKTLKFQANKSVPSSGVDLIQKLLLDEESRLGAGGIQELTTHRFFRHIDWNIINSPRHFSREWIMSKASSGRLWTGCFGCCRSEEGKQLKFDAIHDVSPAGFLLVQDKPSRSKVSMRYLPDISDDRTTLQTPTAQSWSSSSSSGSGVVIKTQMIGNVVNTPGVTSSLNAPRFPPDQPFDKCNMLGCRRWGFESLTQLSVSVKSASATDDSNKAANASVLVAANPSLRAGSSSVDEVGSETRSTALKRCVSFGVTPGSQPQSQETLQPAKLQAASQASSQPILKSRKKKDTRNMYGLFRSVFPATTTTSVEVNSGTSLLSNEMRGPEGGHEGSSQSSTRVVSKRRHAREEISHLFGDVDHPCAMLVTLQDFVIHRSVDTSALCTPLPRESLSCAQKSSSRASESI